MEIQDAIELKDKSDAVFREINTLLFHYQSVLNEESFSEVRLQIGKLLDIMYFDCLKTHVYSKFPELEPKHN